MPASITHMLISRRTRQYLAERAEGEFAEFVDDVLVRRPRYMELGSLGPDLPYFGWKSLFDPNKPLGVDQWSYQLHSKNPNVFPLRLIELAWRESDPTEPGWLDIDKCKFSFACGYLTHVAADQVIHPVVNEIAGSYHRFKAARLKHRRCEIHQDLYALAQESTDGLSAGRLKASRFDRWCNPKYDGWVSPVVAQIGVFDVAWILRKWLVRPPCPMEFVYFLQRAFVEAHAVTPGEAKVERWIKTVRRALWLSKWIPWGWYRRAHRNLFDGDGTLRREGPEYREYIALEKVPGEGHYDDYLHEAIELSGLYVQAAFQLYRARRLNDPIREAFKDVIVNADLGAPLERDVLQTASAHLPELEKLVEDDGA